jgi:hypothetical protein
MEAIWNKEEMKIYILTRNFWDKNGSLQIEFQAAYTTSEEACKASLKITKSKLNIWGYVSIIELIEDGFPYKSMDEKNKILDEFLGSS